jgi:hypothetical protein
MKVSEASALKIGQYVDYLGTRAMVRGVKSNGVIVDYWGKGLQEGKCIVRRVSARYLETVEPTILTPVTATPEPVCTRDNTPLIDMGNYLVDNCSNKYGKMQ